MEIETVPLQFAVLESPFDLSLPIDTATLPRFDRPLTTAVREARLLNDAPWIRSLGRLDLAVQTEGWKFTQKGFCLPDDLRRYVGLPPKPH